MYIKLHPFVKNEIDCSSFSHIEDIPSEYETYDFLNAIDVLITDYSSIMFDFACSKKKIVLFTYDRDEYLDGRGIYIDFNKLPFPACDTVDELIKELSSEHKGYDEFYNEEEKDEHHEHNHTVNSHIWVSPKNAKLQVKNISDELVEIYPQYKEQIEKNRDSYINRLDKLSDELKLAFKDIGGKNIITFHESYEYLAKEYSLNIVATVESHDGEEPSARELAELVDLINEKDVVALFTEPLYKGTVADILSNETGIKVYQLNPVLQGEKSLTAYEDIMRENMSVLKAVK